MYFESVLRIVFFRACAICHFCQNNCFFILLSWLPTYFHDTYPDAKSWIFNVVPWLLMIPGILFANYVVQRLISKGTNVGKARKIAETLCMGTEIICLVTVGKKNSLPFTIFVPTWG